MTAPKPHKRLENLIWILIYGGLLSILAGAVTARAGAIVSHPLVVIGVVAAIAGVVLIFVRARLDQD
ncbi:hypothetical protein [uncultured Xylophilus sp.]|uniref:hypothetical protein n=1 Tax=uncultured Xylophilus sp. TaxID=296832 RepID=UPI0025E5BE86|nr:hypothetical protein [uncultured Xylophilus sp.]